MYNYDCKIQFQKYGTLLLLICAEVVAESLLKNASKTTGSWEYSLILGMVAYIVAAYLFFIFLKSYSGSFGVANIIWQVANILIITIISHFILGNKLNRIQWLGFLFLIAGFILSGLGKGLIS